MTALGVVLAHLVGDYLLQNDWMATEKTKRLEVAVLHGTIYTLPYTVLLVLLGVQGWVLVASVAVISLTHAVIDRWRLAKHVIWFVNRFVPKSYRYSWAEARDNAGYSAAKPAWMAVWLMIIVDNTLHLIINAATVWWALNV